MAILRISDEIEKRLINADESGMGFQLIRYGGDTLIVLNATIAFPLSELREQKVSEDDYPLFSGNPDSEQISRLEKLEIYDKFSIVYSNLDRKLQDRSIGLAFSETAASPPESVIPSGLLIRTTVSLLTTAISVLIHPLATSSPEHTQRRIPTCTLHRVGLRL